VLADPRANGQVEAQLFGARSRLLLSRRSGRERVAAAYLSRLGMSSVIAVGENLESRWGCVSALRGTVLSADALWLRLRGSSRAAALGEDFSIDLTACNRSASTEARL
jgi:hypothetical protein